MSEIDDLMVDVMMRSDDEATNATVRLIQLARDGAISAKQNRHVLKAVERRMEKVTSGTELHEFLLSLAQLIDPSAQPKTSELPPEMDSPDAVLARKMRGNNTPANYERDDTDEADVHPVDRIKRDRTSGMGADDKANFIQPKKSQPNNNPKKQDIDISDYYHPRDKRDD